MIIEELFAKILPSMLSLHRTLMVPIISKASNVVHKIKKNRCDAIALVLILTPIFVLKLTPLS